jgi:hypothetical protein
MQEGKSDPQTLYIGRKLINFFVWSARCFFLRAEGFSSSLDINCNFWSKKDLKIFSCTYFFHQSGFTWIAGSGSGFSESGSTALFLTSVWRFTYSRHVMLSRFERHIMKSISQPLWKFHFITWSASSRDINLKLISLHFWNIP